VVCIGKVCRDNPEEGLDKRIRNVNMSPRLVGYRGTSVATPTMNPMPSVVQERPKCGPVTRRS